MIVSGQVADRDQWGNAYKNQALADIIGAAQKRTQPVESEVSFDFQGIKVSLPYISANKRGDSVSLPVKLDVSAKTEIVSTFTSGGAAVLKNHYGSGTVYYFALTGLGRIVKAPVNSGGLNGDGYPGMSQVFDKILGECYGKQEIEISGLPKGVEYQLQKSGDNYIVCLLDWCNDRNIANYTMRLNIPGKYLVSDLSGAFQTKISSGETIQGPQFNMYTIFVFKPAP